MRIYAAFIVCMLCMVCAGGAIAKDAASSFVTVPSTVSAQAQAALRKMQDPNLQPELPDADDFSGWKAAQEGRELFGIAAQKAIVERLKPEVRQMQLGGVPVLEITPDAWQGSKKTVVYFHGGAYTFFSARSTLGTAAMIADVTGLRVVSVDYTLAPQAGWRQITGQAVAVLQALHKQGTAMNELAVIGDSAGGGLAAGAVLKMRDEGMQLPAAVVLWSPWSDITDTGDSYTTLKHAEPAYLYDKHLKKAAAAYAELPEQKHPYVSPVYGDYSKGFAPTLIQGGTKEIFLSNFVRQYQALDMAGVPVTLDLYEGMTHVFQAMMPDSAEAKTALEKTGRFLRLHLGE
ncbi:alpha/beta hydrolase fold domain-containing protein [Oleidesulfovibrio sp.]|uniref:alpha/beta hydrolase fold domain-containing protein n=1 Tax=Oleidesulfovibrio sp. TaxID=2909707 RepID=UPI003A8AF9EB